MNTKEKLAKYESYLITAHKADYIRALTNAQVEELIQIGKEIGINYKNNHCPKCALEFVKKLAVYYFKPEKVEMKEEIILKPKSDGKKKSTRKSKQDA